MSDRKRMTDARLAEISVKYFSSIVHELADALESERKEFNIAIQHCTDNAIMVVDRDMRIAELEAQFDELRDNLTKAAEDAGLSFPDLVEPDELANKIHHQGAELAKLRTFVEDVKGLKPLINTMAKQKLYDDMSINDIESADFESAYEVYVDNSRDIRRTLQTALDKLENKA